MVEDVQARCFLMERFSGDVLHPDWRNCDLRWERFSLPMIRQPIGLGSVSRSA